MPKEGDIIAGKYLLEKSLGEGGMGEVFQAVHQDIGKRVALKFLQARHCAMPATVTRFQREARIAAAAGHRGIVDIFDVGATDDGLPFMVMELLEGQSLHDLLFAGRQLDIETAAFIGCQVLSALAAAHGAGIVHRDLKPANIFLIDTGAALPDIKLLDFGISRLVGSTLPGEDQSMTQTGAVLGTPTYMSPEQAMGEKERIDQRTDLYAMGVILYEMTTGTLPFVAANYNSLIVTIMTADPALPSTHRPDIPRALEAIIVKALARDPEDRFKSASEMFQALLPFVDEASLGRIIRPPGTSRPLSHETSRLQARPASPAPADGHPHGPADIASPDAPASRRASPVIWAAGGAIGAIVVLGAGLAVWSGFGSTGAVAPPLERPLDAGAVEGPRDVSGATPTTSFISGTVDDAGAGRHDEPTATTTDEADAGTTDSAAEPAGPPARPRPDPARTPRHEPHEPAPVPVPPPTERGVYVD
jgi:serine/threonine-protein kinase